MGDRKHSGAKHNGAKHTGAKHSGKRKGRGGKGKGEGNGSVPDFDIVLWGYDREQVRRCLDDMTARLEVALSQLDSMEVLQSELCDAQVEIEQLRQAADEQPSLAGRISKLMSVAEQLRSQAERDADTIRATARAEGRGEAPSAGSGAPAERAAPVASGS